jgi:hypothetical protein
LKEEILMRRTICILLAAAAAASAQADIHAVKPGERSAARHAGIHIGKDLNLKGLLLSCSALVSAARENTTISLALLETCSDAAKPGETLPPSGDKPKITGESTVSGAGACSVVGEAGRSC